MADDLSYLETVDDSKRLEKPKSTGTKLLAVIAPDDDCLDPNTENYIDGAKAGGFLPALVIASFSFTRHLIPSSL